jgi:hypothetical protein
MFRQSRQEEPFDIVNRKLRFDPNSIYCVFTIQFEITICKSNTPKLQKIANREKRRNFFAKRTAGPNHLYNKGIRTSGFENLDYVKNCGQVVSNISR